MPMTSEHHLFDARFLTFVVFDMTFGNIYCTTEFWVPECAFASQLLQSLGHAINASVCASHCDSARCWLGLCQPVLPGILQILCADNAFQCTKHVAATLALYTHFAACLRIRFHCIRLTPVHVPVRLVNARVAVSSIHLLAVHKGCAASMPIQPCHSACYSCMYNHTWTCMFLETYMSALNAAAAANTETCVQPLQCTPLLLTSIGILDLTCWHE